MDESSGASSCGFTLFDAFERSAALHAQRPAVRCGSNTWSFQQLHSRVSAVCTALRERWLRPGDRVVVRSDNCHRYMELYLACAGLGAIVVPLDVRLAEEEVRAILAETAPTLLVADQVERLEWMHRLYSGAEASVLLGDGSTPSGEGVVAYESLTSGPTRPVRDGVIGADAPVALFYTAAVAGRPRGAALTHRNLITQVTTTGEPLDIGEQDAHGVFLPLSHTFGAYLMFVAVCRGAANTMLTSFDPNEAARRIAAGEVSFFAEFAPMAARIADAADAAKSAFPGGLRLVMGLDAPVTIARYRDAGVQWWGFYGQTETAGLVAMGRVGDGPIESNYVGRPLPLVRMSVRDSKGSPVEPGEPGEAWVRSDAVVQRYWPDEPTRLTQDGWLRTGDVLRVGADQNMWFIGRTSDKDLIKPGGLNVYPAEVELALQAHPAVSRAFVFGVPDPAWRERVCAVVLPSAEFGGTDAAALAAFCATKIAGFKCPRADSIVIVADGGDLPEAPSREAMRRRYGARLETVAKGAADEAAK
nr:class I adenylate-forming enzyme family protein [Leekyejoonella antrihumi]